MGALRLFLPDKYIDIVPRMGRAVLFKSEVVEHEVRPTIGYDNYALTVWFNQVVKKKKESLAPKTVPEDYTIFVGILAYRDLHLMNTMRSLYNRAYDKERLRIRVYYQINLSDFEEIMQLT